MVELEKALVAGSAQGSNLLRESVIKAALIKTWFHLLTLVVPELKVILDRLLAFIKI